MIMDIVGIWCHVRSDATHVGPEPSIFRVWAWTSQGSHERTCVSSRDTWNATLGHAEHGRATQNHVTPVLFSIVVYIGRRLPFKYKKNQNIIPYCSLLKSWIRTFVFKSSCIDRRSVNVELSWVAKCRTIGCTIVFESISGIPESRSGTMVRGWQPYSWAWWWCLLDSRSGRTRNYTRYRLFFIPMFQFALK